MSYPSEEELLLASDPPAWIDRHFLRQDPYAFQGVALTFHEVACEMAEQLDVERNGIFCIGSGAIGLSINPAKVDGNRLKVFAPDSDLDVAIISSRYFEMAWRDLLRATQPHLEEVPQEVLANISWQRKRLFDGAILANKLLGSLSFGKDWLAVIDRISGKVADALDRNVTIEAWIYRDYWSLRNYIVRGVVDCQAKVTVERR